MQEVCAIDPLIKTEAQVLPVVQIMGPQQQNHLINSNNNQSLPLIANQHNPHNPSPTAPKLGTNCDSNKQRAPDNNTGSYWMPTETGFINSQPSMAEFLTHLGPDSSPKMDQQAFSSGGATDDGNPVPEYPWMKEKKTARKNGSQSKCEKCIIKYFCKLMTVVFK